MYTKQRLLVSMASLCYEMTFVTIQKNKVTTIERPSALTCSLRVLFFFLFFYLLLLLFFSYLLLLLLLLYFFFFFGGGGGAVFIRQG